MENYTTEYITIKKTPSGRFYKQFDEDAFFRISKKEFEESIQGAKSRNELLQEGNSEYNGYSFWLYIN